MDKEIKETKMTYPLKGKDERLQSIYIEQIEDYMKNHKISRSELAKQIEIGGSTLGDFVKRRHKASTKTLEKIIKFFQNSYSYIEQIESRFKEVANLDCDMTIFPIESEETQVKTRKDKSKAHGEVFTPLHLVDKMVAKKDDNYWLDESKVNCDLCSGYGQFTIRILRKKYNLNGFYPLKNYLYENHLMVELQESSVLKLMYIFGVENISLCIGDARKLSELKEDDRGIMLYNGSKWVDISKRARHFYYKNKMDKQMPSSDVIALWEKNLKGMS